MRNVAADIPRSLNKRLCRLLNEICNVVGQNFKVSLKLYHPTSLIVAKGVKTGGRIHGLKC